MNKKVIGSRLSDHSLVKTVHCGRRRLGFTLIELLIVISLFGLAAAMVTASYLTFERKERVKSTALALKGDIRLAANKAHSGDKGFAVDDKCDTTRGDVLVGWYVQMVAGQDTYSIAGDCLVSGVEQQFGKEVFRLPKDVRIASISSNNEANILFRPLTENVTFHYLTAGSPEFLDDNGVLDNETGDEEILIDLLGPAGNRYQVKVLKSGGVFEKKL